MSLIPRLCRDFADIYTLTPRACGPWGSGVYISKIPCSCGITITYIVFILVLCTIDTSTVVLYIRDHEGLGFPSQKIHPKTSFTTPSWHLGSIG